MQYCNVHGVAWHQRDVKENLKGKHLDLFNENVETSSRIFIIISTLMLKYYCIKTNIRMFTKITLMVVLYESHLYIFGFLNLLSSWDEKVLSFTR